MIRHSLEDSMSHTSAIAPHPVHLDFHGAVRIARWRPVVQWFLAIPHLVVVYALGIVRAVLVTGRIPRPLFDVMAMTLRYEWRVTTYALFMRQDYPPFDFQPMAADDGADRHTVVAFAYPELLSRWQPLVRWLLAIRSTSCWYVWASPPPPVCSRAWPPCWSPESTHWGFAPSSSMPMATTCVFRPTSACSPMATRHSACTSADLELDPREGTMEHLPDRPMAGRTVLITGGTGGIGKATALGLATLGADVAIVGRDRGRVATAVREIRAVDGGGQVDGFVAELSAQDEVRRLATEVRQALARIDVLVNNVGGYWSDRHLTADGLERTFAVNHVAPFLLTALLRDRLAV